MRRRAAAMARTPAHWRWRRGPCCAAFFAALGSAAAVRAPGAAEGRVELLCDLGIVADAIVAEAFPIEVAVRFPDVLMALRHTLQDMAVFVRRFYELTRRGEPVSRDFVEDARWITANVRQQLRDLSHMRSAIQDGTLGSFFFCADLLLSEWLAYGVADRMADAVSCPLEVLLDCRRLLLSDLSSLDAMLQGSPDIDSAAAWAAVVRGGAARRSVPEMAAPAARREDVAGGRADEPRDAVLGAAPSAALPAPEGAAASQALHGASQAVPAAILEAPRRTPLEAPLGARTPAPGPCAVTETLPLLLLAAVAGEVDAIPELLPPWAAADPLPQPGLPCPSLRPPAEPCNIEVAIIALTEECALWVHKVRALLMPCAIRDTLMSMRMMAASASRLVRNSASVRKRWRQRQLQEHSSIAARLKFLLRHSDGAREVYHCPAALAESWSAPAIVEPLRHACHMKGAAQRAQIAEFAWQVCRLDPHLEREFGAQLDAFLAEAGGPRPSLLPAPGR